MFICSQVDLSLPIELVIVYLIIECSRVGKLNLGAIKRSAPTQFSDVDELGESRPGIEIRLRDDSDEHRELPQEQSRRRSRQGNGVRHFGRLTFMYFWRT